MIATFYHRGTYPTLNIYCYDVFCENGIVFQTKEYTYIKHESRHILPDDMCMFDSGWLHWQCEKDGLAYWTRTRPGGKVCCPMCGHEEIVPLEAVMMPFEGADMNDYIRELEEE